MAIAEVEAVIPDPEIFAINGPEALGAMNNARPVESVITFCSPESSTATPGCNRPDESTTASVACSRATTLGGRMIMRGAGDGRREVVWLRAIPGQAVSNTPSAKNKWPACT